MAVSGLDAEKVNQAYQAALNEAGGWFFLKYVSRDELELLDHGVGGYGEAKEAILEYPDKSPLYGFLLYRRRKIFVKYIPQGTSRVRIAWLSVHLETLIDRFSPHDAILEATSPDDFSEHNLSSLCSLHTSASMNSSVAGSIRRQELDEIREDAEESPVSRATERAPVIPGFETLETMADSGFVSAHSPQVPMFDADMARYAVEARTDVSSPMKTPQKQPSRDLVSPISWEQDSAPQLPEVKVSSFQLAIQRMVPEDLSNDRISKDTHRYPDVSPPEPEPAQLYPFGPTVPTELPTLPQDSRPPSSDTFRYGLGGFTKKAKLFPRPAEQRPETPSSFRQKLPSGIRMAFQKKDPDRPKTARSRKSPRAEKKPQLPPVPPPVLEPSLDRTTNGPRPVPKLYAVQKAEDAAKKSPMNGGIEPSSVSPSPYPSKLVSATINSISTEPAAEELERSASITSDHPSVLTPERQRLMKALQLRNQQIRAAAFARSDHARDISVLDGTSHFDSSTSEKAIALSRDLRNTVEALKPSAKVDSGVELSQPVEQPKENAKLDNTDAYDSATSTKSRVVPPPLVIPPKSPRRGVASPIATAGAATDQDRIPLASKQEDPVITPRSKALPPTPRSLTTDHTKRKSRRRTAVDADKAAANGEIDEEYASDNSLMEALQSATVEQAKPMAVASPKDPVVSTRIKRSGDRWGSNSSNTPSNTANAIPHSPVKVKSEVPAAGLVRRESNARANASAGISRRIKTLASREGGGTGSPYGLQPEADMPAAYASFRNQPVYSNSRPPSFIAASLSESRPTSPRLHFSALPLRKSPQFEAFDPIAAMYHMPHRAATSDSISVTARIVRDGQRDNMSIRSPVEDDSLSLYRSPLTVTEHGPDHVRSPLSSTREFPPLEKPASIFSSMRPVSRESNYSSMTRKSRDGGWRAMSRRRDEPLPPLPASRAGHTGDPAPPAMAGDEAVPTEKRRSMTTRIYNRMGGGRRKNSMDMNNPMLAPATSREKPNAVVVGDLNVQFPDTLLWKRRWVEVDEQGYLVLAVSKTLQQTPTAVKKYNMLEFKTPRIPLSDRQELPYSVVADFVTGSSLQFACEDGVSQAQIFRRLRDIHRAWIMYKA